MNVILLENVPKLGSLGDQVRVRSGFARNYLIPQKMALPSTKANIASFENRRAELEKLAKDRLQGAEKRAAQLQDISVTVFTEAGEEGRLFGSVSAHDIMRALQEQGHTINKSEVRLQEGPLRVLGEHDVNLQLQGSSIVIPIKVIIKQTV